VPSFEKADKVAATVAAGATTAKASKKTHTRH
jgi:hypothetical protein